MRRKWKKERNAIGSVGADLRVRAGDMSLGGQGGRRGGFGEGTTTAGGGAGAAVSARLKRVL